MILFFPGPNVSGFGHLTRCLAIQRHLSAESRVVVRPFNDGLLSCQGDDLDCVEYRDDYWNALQQYDPDVIVVDSYYNLDPRMIKDWKRAKKVLIFRYHQSKDSDLRVFHSIRRQYDYVIVPNTEQTRRPPLTKYGILSSHVGHVLIRQPDECYSQTEARERLTDMGITDFSQYRVRSGHEVLQGTEPAIYPDVLFWRAYDRLEVPFSYNSFYQAHGLGIADRCDFYAYEGMRDQIERKCYVHDAGVAVGEFDGAIRAARLLEALV